MREERKNAAGIYVKKPAVANLGILMFYQALSDQKCKCTQLNWTPDYETESDIKELLDEFL